MKSNFALDADELNLVKLAQEYSDEDNARALLESLRWPDGVKCPHCKNHKERPIYKLEPRRTSTKPVRAGVYKCGDCRKQFTVRVGTIFEDSHIPISKWLMAYFILCSSKKSVSAHQIHRMFGVTYKTAWFMCHRIRYAMRRQSHGGKLGDVVEVDETYVGGKPRPGEPSKAGRGTLHKVPVVALIERDGPARVQVVANVSAKTLRSFVDSNIDKGATVNTDEWNAYRPLFRDYARHDVVKHSDKVYARHNADGTVSHVNTCESFFSLIKRGVYGAFHHVSREHLPRYCDEFAFRWDFRKVSDGKRMVAAIEHSEGKRLTYRQAI